MAPRLSIREISLFERPMRFSHPFRFGSSLVEAAPQAFARVDIDVEGYGRATGASAEMMIPRWFDKRPQKSPLQTVDELRCSLTLARDAYLGSATPVCAFAHHASHVESQHEACSRHDIPALAALFGPALLDKAILDALLRALDIGVFEGLRRNVVGLDARLTPDLQDARIDMFLNARKPQPTIAVRHTVGLDDHLEDLPGIARPNGLRYFKLKLSGDPDADCKRLLRIGGELDGLGWQSFVTLDANEQYADLRALQTLYTELETDRLRSIAQRLLYLEQPIPRELTFESPLGALAERPFIIDEADDRYEAFPKARACGYRGVSIKSCKGLYKAILNTARAEAWCEEAGAGAYFISAEDLTCQAGLAVQQDTALASFLGATHVERNGHHYVAGFGTAAPAEAEAFLRGHPDLYASSPAGPHLAIHEGALSTRSLTGSGFAADATPIWSDLAPLSPAGLERIVP